MLEKMMQDVCLKGCKKDLAKFYELKTSCIQIFNEPLKNLKSNNY